MEQKLTQRERVEQRLKEVGYVDNFWAMHNYILRLGAIIHAMRKDGEEILGAFGKELGKEKGMWKNYYYYPNKKGQLNMFE